MSMVPTTGARRLINGRLERKEIKTPHIKIRPEKARLRVFAPAASRRRREAPDRSFFPTKAVLQRSFLCVIPAPRVADSQKRLLAVAVRSSRDDYATPFVCPAASGLSVRTSCGSRKKAKVHHNFPPYSLVYFEVPGKKQRSIIIPQNEGGKL